MPRSLALVEQIPPVYLWSCHMLGPFRHIAHVSAVYADVASRSSLLRSGYSWIDISHCASSESPSSASAVARVHEGPCVQYGCLSAVCCLGGLLIL